MWVLGLGVQGGGVSIELGCYPFQFAMLAFGSDEPESIAAAGNLSSRGVDLTAAVGLKWARPRRSAGEAAERGGAGGRAASLYWSFEVPTQEEAVFVGTGGRIRVNGPAHSPDRLTVTTVATERFQPENVVELTFPLPEPPP